MIHVPQRQQRLKYGIINVPPQQQIRAPVYKKQLQHVPVEFSLFPAVPGEGLNDPKLLLRLFNNFGIKIINNYKQFITLVDGSVLGQGFNGSVFIGSLRDRPNENVAVKTQDFSKEVIRGIYVLKANHPNLMNLKDTFYDTIEKKMIVTMEVIPASLFMVWGAYVTRSGYDFTDLCLLYILYELTKSLNYLLNKLRFFCNDIKPVNVLVNASGETKLTGFGASRLLNSKSNYASGTYCYMAPECADMKKSLGIESDSWSLGISLIESIDLNRYFLTFFIRASKDDRRQSIAAIEYPPNCKREMSIKLHDILRRLLKIDLNQRISMVNLVKTIESYVENKEVKTYSKQ